MKQSLAKKITIKMAILIITGLLLFLIGSFVVVTNMLFKEVYSYNRAIASTICDLLTYQANMDGRPVDMRSKDDADLYSDYFCTWGRVEYICIYYLTDNNTKITYLGYSSKEDSEYSQNNYEDFIGNTYDYSYDNEDSNEDNKLLRPDEQSAKAVARSDRYHGTEVVVEAGLSYKSLMKMIAESFRVLVYILIGVFLFLTIFMYFLIRKRVFIPAKRISDSMTEFIQNDEFTNIQLDDSGDDEFAMIAASFNKMIKDIDKYLEHIREISNVQEREKAELEIASKIQSGFLLPGEYKSDNYEIYSTMIPAKNVGGDLYDYMIMEDGRVYFCVADVSGKGIPACLFMAVTLSLIRQYAMMNYQPAEILEMVNNRLSEHNPKMLFTTAFLGLYDPKTKMLTYANAGHNVPYLFRNQPKPLDGAKNIVLGLFSNEKYTQEEISLELGDIIFLFTDGVTEAVDNGRSFYGLERLEKALYAYSYVDDENIVDYVKHSVEDFMDGCEQFDDITMLSLTLTDRTVIEIKPDELEIDQIRSTILNRSRLSRSENLKLCVAAEEIFVNICSYAFSDAEKVENGKIRFIFEHSDRIKIVFEDNGNPYDPTSGESEEVDFDPDLQMGGLGKLIAFTIADNVLYEYKDNKNVLTLIKYDNIE